MKNLKQLAVVALTSSILVACGSNDDGTTNSTPSSTAQFEVTVTNLTHAQPLSPVAVMLHQNGFHSFVDGNTASLALESLAEGGSNADILSEVLAAAQHVASASTEGPVPPRAISPVVTLDVPLADLNNLRLSVISMLVHTNDAFTGTNSADVSGMAVGDTRTLTGPTWDSGTEANSETRATMPGPDFAGEGFNAERDDFLDVIRIHQSVVTGENAEFGLVTSDLEDRHRFLNPTTRIIVMRVQ